MARTANDGGMIADQVWDGRPPTGQGGRRAREGTQAATPLAWSRRAAERSGRIDVAFCFPSMSR